ncbi:MAG: vancomycin high temperature exclusion protein [Bacteroidia bacterium]|nr:MAG: vancomycin high temperature exclusion protein [Bacteroidia bacterium]
MRLFFRRGLVLLEILVVIPLLVLLISNQVIRISAEKHLYDSIHEIPHNRVGLVLGTSHRIRGGAPNPYFHNRINAAAELYHSGKVNYLIVSGDNRTPYYNEPLQMQRALMNLNIPEEAIYLDHAGFRTLDSVVRAMKIFGQDSITIISQRFHNQRAVYIAKQNGMQVYALNAADVNHLRNDRIRIREWFAKANVFWDILVGKEPEIMGERIPVGDDPS